jgi:hypothetical protein
VRAAAARPAAPGPAAAHLLRARRQRDRRGAARPSAAVGAAHRVGLRADLRRPLHGALQARVVQLRVGVLGAQHRLERRRHVHELGVVGEQPLHVGVDARGREPLALALRLGAVGERLGLDAESGPRGGDEVAEAGAELRELGGVEADLGAVGLTEQQVAADHLLDELRDERVGRLRELLRHVRLRGDRLEPVGEAPGGEVALVGGRHHRVVAAVRADVLRDRLRGGRRVAAELHVGALLELGHVRALGRLAGLPPAACATCACTSANGCRRMMW